MAEWLEHLVHQHGTWIVGVIIFLESMGLPLPGESILIAAGVYAGSHGGLAIEWVVLFAAIGAVLGDNVGYLIGREAGRRALIRWGGRIGLTSERVTLADYMFHRHGPKMVFFGRFTALLRTIAALLAGATRMQWPRFLVWNALGGVCWTALYGFGAYLLGANIDAVLGPAGLVVGVAALAAIIAIALFIRRNERRLIADAQRWAAATDSQRS